MGGSKPPHDPREDGGLPTAYAPAGHVGPGTLAAVAAQSSPLSGGAIIHGCFKRTSSLSDPRCTALPRAGKGS